MYKEIIDLLHELIKNELDISEKIIDETIMSNVDKLIFKQTNLLLAMRIRIKFETELEKIFKEEE